MRKINYKNIRIEDLGLKIYQALFHSNDNPMGAEGGGQQSVIFWLFQEKIHLRDQN
jgi:hypothetical protein